jgi:hypothetical protein
MADQTGEGADPELEKQLAELARMPGLNRAAFYCPRCSAYADQSWTHPKVSVSGSWEQIADSLPEFRQVGSTSVRMPMGVWAMSTCRSCRESSLWRETRLIFPAGSALAPPPHSDMPPEAKELYREAADVVGVSRRAGAALARAALERLLKSVDPVEERVDLEKRIERVLPDVSVGLADMLTVIRHVGNKSLHGEDEPDDVMVLVLDPDEEEIVDMIFTAVNNTVEELITRPKKTAGFFAKVPEGVRKRVEAARAKEAGAE